MGANRLYDFLLVHRYLGINNMISLEYDPGMFERARFNCPYSFIDVLPETAESYIGDDPFQEPAVLWLDYDKGISRRIVADIASLAIKLKVGDFCFVTVYGGPPDALDRKNDEERLVWFQDVLADVSGDVSLEDVERSSFPKAVHKTLVSAFQNAFASRRDGAFIPFLQIQYSDSVPMMTVGGGLLADGQVHAFKARMADALPFLALGETKIYRIRSLNLTERERALFDLATTKRRKRSPEYNALRKLGFKDSDLKAYKDLLRYLPRYVETIV